MNDSVVDEVAPGYDPTLLESVESGVGRSERVDSALTAVPFQQSLVETCGDLRATSMTNLLSNSLRQLARIEQYAKDRSAIDGVLAERLSHLRAITLK